MKSFVATLILVFVVGSPAMADLKDDLIAIEKTAWTTWASRDGKAFGAMLTEDAVLAVAGAPVAMGRDEIMANVSSSDCQMKSFDFADVKLRQLSPDIAILTYTATQDTTCQGQKLPGTVYSTTIYVRQGGEWRTTNYQETALE
jgi:uncharacterized protein (TIGR02246 family)